MYHLGVNAACWGCARLYLECSCRSGVDRRADSLSSGWCWGEHCPAAPPLPACPPACCSDLQSYFYLHSCILLHACPVQKEAPGHLGQSPCG